MNTKEIFIIAREWIGGVIDVMSAFIALGVLSEIIFGSGVFGVSVVENLTGLVAHFGANGFVGLIALLILVGLFNRK